MMSPQYASPIRPREWRSLRLLTIGPPPCDLPDDDYGREKGALGAGISEGGVKSPGVV